MNPNGQNQWWSKWTFLIHEAGRHPPRRDVELNAARWMRAAFGSVGTVRVQRVLTPRVGWRVEVIVEGKPAHDLAYVEAMRLEFQRTFVERGWGPLGAWSEVSARLIAGSRQDGTPSEQWVSIPTLRLEEEGCR